MRSLTRSVIFLVLLSCGSLVAESPGSLLKKGMKAEARQDYEAAYNYYKQAYDKRPDDLKYRVPFERTRFLAAATKVRQGQRLRDQGNLTGALEQFAKAVEIDPSNDLAQQEVRHTQEMMKKQAAGQATQEAAPPPPPEDPLREMLDKAQGPVELAPISNPPIVIKADNDSKAIYETIGKLAGINVLFDPDYQSRRVHVDLQGVTLQQALDIVALETRTFWRPVTPNTIFIAADNTGKRRELEQNVIKTFYLGNVATPTDLQDVVNAIRTILEVQRIQQVPSQNAIVVRGTPDQLALAQKMIDDIDKSKPEVVVDVVVAQVRRDKVRQLGLLPPQNATVALQGSNSTTSTTTNPSTGTTTPTTTTNSGSLNFNDLQHLNSTNYAVSIDPLHAQLLFNDNDSKILENPQIRAADGIKATLKIGDRIPVATGSFGTPLGIGTGVGALGVNTQFQYLDVGVNIDITPHVHPDNEISLKISLEISNQNGSSSIGGISQPIISRRTVDHEIRLRDGEMNLLGGILEDTVSNNLSGVPVLGQIPILGRLFSQQDKERHTNEIVFLVVPHIVRGQTLTPLNRKEFDVGTSSGIDLRVVENPPANNGTKPASQVHPAGQAAAPQPTPQAQQFAPGQPQQQFNPAAQQQQQPQQFVPPQQPIQAQPVPSGAGVPGNVQPPGSMPVQQQSQPSTVQQQPGQPVSMQPQSTPSPQSEPQGQQPSSGAAQSSNNPATPGQNGSVTFRLDPAVVAPKEGNSFNVNVLLTGGQDVAGVTLQVAYDPKVLQFGQATSGEFLSRDGQPVPIVQRNDAASGTLQIAAQRPPGAPGVSGDGVVLNLMFTAKGRGASGIVIVSPGARNSQNQPLQALGSQASVNVN
jgi:general secretion pathway protein D